VIVEILLRDRIIAKQKAATDHAGKDMRDRHLARVKRFAASQSNHGKFSRTGVKPKVAMRRNAPPPETTSTPENMLSLRLIGSEFRGAISKGSVEGMNNKAKLAMNRAYGFKSYETIEIALYHRARKASGANSNPQILRKR